MLTLTKQTLTQLGASDADAERYLADFDQLLNEHDIDSRLRVAHFLAQAYYESTNLHRSSENLDYSSSERLLQVFAKYIGVNEAAEFVHAPERLANRVYAGRNGNGDESTGDGWRYRGRGLIQLTGRRNYRSLSDWLGQDVTVDPEPVATRFAVHSAVYYWTENDVNIPADADDVRTVTRRINGGLTGLAERTQLLDRAKAILGFNAAAAIADIGATDRVSANGLNLRSAPRVVASTFIATLPQGTPVTRLSDGGAPGWVRVRALLSQGIVEGVVAAQYLEPLPSHPAAAAAAISVAAPASMRPPEVHLSRDDPNVTRARDGGRAQGLGEAGQPARSATAPKARAPELLDIVAWLDSEAPAHLRYQPKGVTTYCNVYAYDYCCLAGVYLPRVWWTGNALIRIAGGETVPVEYGRTVEELTANRLHSWLSEYGSAFGWRRETALDVLQASANSGEVCLVTAQRADLERPGHITAVIPEHGELAAARNARGEVLRPVESQAGRVNRRAVVQPNPWWSGPNYRDFGFWRHISSNDDVAMEGARLFATSPGDARMNVFKTYFNVPDRSKLTFRVDDTKNDVHCRADLADTTRKVADWRGDDIKDADGASSNALESVSRAYTLTVDLTYSKDATATVTVRLVDATGNAVQEPWVIDVPGKAEQTHSAIATIIMA